MLSASASHAVLLEQKWQAGQSLNYRMALEGTANVKVPADAPVFFAGLPLEIEVQGEGDASLDTLSVDPAGTGTVAFKVPNMKFKIQTFGQNGEWNLRDGEGRFSLNGKAMGPITKLPTSSPKTALKIGKDGKIRGFQSLETKPETPAATDQTPVAPAKAINQTALIASAVVQALPALWPNRDVAVGEKWDAKIEFAPIAKKDAGGTPQPLGNFNMILKDKQIVEGVELWRVGVNGEVSVDGAQLGDSAKIAKGRPRLDTASQKIDGDLWFDAAKGQIARADLVLGSRAQSRTAKGDDQWSEPSWFDFAGNLQLRLRDGA